MFIVFIHSDEQVLQKFSFTEFNYRTIYLISSDDINLNVPNINSVYSMDEKYVNEKQSTDLIQTMEYCVTKFSSYDIILFIHYKPEQKERYIEFVNNWQLIIDKIYTIDRCLKPQFSQDMHFIHDFYNDIHTYTKIDNQEITNELSYLHILRDLLFSKNPPRQTRNALVKSAFSQHIEFDLSPENGNIFPVLTTKRIFWKAIVYELLFFLGGCTDNKWLQERGVHIWDGNTSRKFLDSVGLTKYEEGDLGPMYGFNWRFFGAEYGSSKDSYIGHGKDQFANVISLLLNDPFSRRIMMTTYDPETADEGCLKPCHGLIVQFYVDNDYSISIQMYQRSADWFLGVPFNIASYSLLLHIMVNYLNYIQTTRFYRCGKLHITFGDYHLYSDHIIPAITQLLRPPKPFPTLHITDAITSIEPEYFLSLSHENFKLINYEPHSAIKASML